MSSSNINDPGAIQALLDQLRASEAWQNTVNAVAASQASQPPAANAASAAQETGPIADSGAATSTTSQVPAHTGPRGLVEPEAPLTGAQSSRPSNAHSVASLLSQLQTSRSLAAVVAGSSSSSTPIIARPRQPPPAQAGGSEFPGPNVAALPSGTGTGSSDTGPAPAPAARQRQDVRACTFQQALPHLARLSADAGFLKALAAMRTEQADLERQLWKERREIQRGHEEKVSTARTKASIIGAGLTPYEADALTDSFRAELQRFDRERVLPAWDGLLAKQQAALEALGVPAMFPTAQAADRERQQEIMQVLGRIVRTETQSTRSPGDGRG